MGVARASKKGSVQVAEKYVGSQEEETVLS